MDSTELIAPTVDEDETVWKRRHPGVAAVLTALVVVFLLFTLVSAFAFKWGSYSLALDYLGGNRVVLSPGTAYLENLDFKNKTHPVEFTIINMSDQPISIVRQRVTCGCISKIELPVEIPSGEKRIFVVYIKLKARVPGKPFRERIAFTTNDPDHFELSAFIRWN